MKTLLLKNKRVLSSTVFGFTKNNTGFTLIELMVAISIIGIFSSFLLINFRANQKNRNFNINNLAIIDGIKKAQTMSLSGRLPLDDSGNPYSPDGYAWVVDRCDEDCFYRIMSCDVDESGGVGLDREIEKVFFHRDINIESEKTTIIFFPPRADSIVLDDDDNEVEIAMIKVGHDDDSVESVCVNFNSMSGRVSFVNCN